MTRQSAISTATVEEVRQILAHQLDLLWQSPPEEASAIAPVMVWGPPGVGKSAVIREIAAERGIGFIDIRLSQREPVDMRGLPVPDNEHDQVRWLLASEWPRDPASRGIILFDELTAADRTLQVAAYELILDRRLGDLYRLPSGWLVCAAGNRSSDRAIAMTLSSALSNRFCHVELRAEYEPWRAWAIKRGLHPDVIAFLRFRPQCFFDMSGDLERGWPSPRTWERVAVSLAHSRQPSVLPLIIEGLVGPAAATEFLAFRTLAAKMPDAVALLRGELPFKEPAKADQKYALCAALAHHVWRAPQGEHRQWMTNFLKIGLELPSDFATMAMMDALLFLEADPQPELAERLFGNQLYEAWQQRHGAVILPPGVSEIETERTGRAGGEAAVRGTGALARGVVQAEAQSEPMLTPTPPRGPSGARVRPSRKP